MEGLYDPHYKLINELYNNLEYLLKCINNDDLTIKDMKVIIKLLILKLISIQRLEQYNMNIIRWFN